MSESQYVHPEAWSVEQVADWLGALGLSSVSQLTLTGSELLRTNISELVGLGVQEDQANRIAHEIEKVVEGCNSREQQAAATAAAEEEGLDQSEDDDDEAAAAAEASLQRFLQLEQRQAELQGMQIPSQLFKIERRVSALEQQLGSMAALEEQSRAALAKAQQTYQSLGAGKVWHPGKLLLHNKDAKLEVEQAQEELQQREQQKAGIAAQLHNSSRRFLLWKSMEAELQQVHAELAELEAALFDSGSTAAGVAGAACVEGEAPHSDEGSQQGPGGQAQDTAHSTPTPAKAPKLFQGKVLAAVADTMGRVDPAKHKDEFGGWGRGRLLRLTANKLHRAAEARRREREEGMRRVEGGIRARGGGKLRDIPEDLQHLFPKDACSFNPAIDCPPTAFLWPYPHSFLGKLQRLQTGPVLQAFYRFGPFDTDPDNPGRLIPADRGDAPPLFLLSGLGSTMIAWGVPLLCALATNHEVIIMEYRGAGLSKNLEDEPWSYYNQAEAVLLLADALGIPKFDWLGWSSGGNTGLVLAALYGDRVRRMVSHAGMAGGPNTIVPAAYHLLDPSLSLSLGQTMALVFPPDNPAEFKATCCEYIKAVFSMPGSITDQEVGAQAAREQWAADLEFITRDGRVWDALPGVRCRCLLMNGDKDVLVPHDNAVHIAARIPGARVHAWPGWGHGFKDAARFAHAVSEFLLAD